MGWVKGKTYHLERYVYTVQNIYNIRLSKGYAKKMLA